MKTPKSSDPNKPLLSDIQNDEYWTSKVGFYMLWLEYLVISPSYELARRYNAGKLTADDEAKLPADFDQVLAVYEDFGDIQRELFLPWWREKGRSLCAFKGAKPRVSKLAELKYSNERLPNPSPRINNYIEDKWIEQGGQNTILVAIPVGIPKSQVAKQVGAILGKYSKRVKTLEHPEPKYSLAGKRHNSNILMRYINVVVTRAARPNAALWRIGAATKISATYSHRFKYNSKIVGNDLLYSRNSLSILTSRAFQRGLSISENAARGIFPSHAACEHAVEPDLSELSERFRSRRQWKKDNKVDGVQK
ncbi:hypothetical protein A9Q96_00530 [Rhodobacterales bacterium 52_120_T64]|nr:hypothetical protein A9Q96_00530 [Rhodobacterales bacterium 52_120_T64]